MISETFIEIDNYKLSKHGPSVSGDITLTKRIDNDRIISILCDGLGSGVEANVLASFTASMGIEYITDDLNITSAAELIMDALPLCPLRKISYSTFSIVDMFKDSSVRIIEHGNPPFLFFRSSTPITYNPKELQRPRWQNRSLQYTHVNATIGDRIILVSDGVTQSGLGSDLWPMGFGQERISGLISEIICQFPLISASDLSRKICETALSNDLNKAGDDITCLVMYIRHPRNLRVLTGPPVDPKRDPEFASLIKDWDGKSAVCGGTTSNIVERELNKNATMNFDTIDTFVPVTSTMEGIDLVTEGCITLGYCVRLLEDKDLFKSKRNGAVQLRDLFLSSDIIEFYVGTRINQAHQDPDLPIELDIRRNTIKKICSLLEKEYFKKTIIRYF